MGSMAFSSSSSVSSFHEPGASAVSPSLVGSGVAASANVRFGEPAGAVLDPLPQNVRLAVEFVELPEGLVPHLCGYKPHNCSHLALLRETCAAGLKVHHGGLSRCTPVGSVQHGRASWHSATSSQCKVSATVPCLQAQLHSDPICFGFATCWTVLMTESRDPEVLLSSGCQLKCK